MSVVFTLLGALWLIWLLWALYVFTMGIYRLHLNDQLNGLNKVLATPIVVVAFGVDVLVNLTIAIPIFLDIPREWVLTSRLQRYMEKGFGWRYRIARYICNHMLDLFDPRGKHC